MKTHKNIYETDTRRLIGLLHICGAGRNWLFTFSGDAIRLDDSYNLDADEYWEIHQEHILDVFSASMNRVLNRELIEYPPVMSLAIRGMAPDHFN